MSFTVTQVAKVPTRRIERIRANEHFSLCIIKTKGAFKKECRIARRKKISMTINF